MTKFRDLKVGQTFDFIGPDRMLNSFFERCTKRSARTYSWVVNAGYSTERTITARVGSINVEVYHVGEAA